MEKTNILVSGLTCIEITELAKHLFCGSAARCYFSHVCRL